MLLYHAKKIAIEDMEKKILKLLLWELQYKLSNLAKLAIYVKVSYDMRSCTY